MLERVRFPLGSPVFDRPSGQGLGAKPPLASAAMVQKVFRASTSMNARHRSLAWLSSRKPVNFAWRAGSPIALEQIGSSWHTFTARARKSGSRAKQEPTSLCSWPFRFRDSFRNGGRREDHSSRLQHCFHPCSKITLL